MILAALAAEEQLLRRGSHQGQESHRAVAVAPVLMHHGPRITALTGKHMVDAMDSTNRGSMNTVQTAAARTTMALVDFLMYPIANIAPLWLRNWQCYFY